MLHESDPSDPATARQQMVAQQVRTSDVTDDRVLAVLEDLPREAFVPAAYRHTAYADTRIPLPHGECMLSPAVEGQLLQALELEPEDSVLEVGTGSGFLTAALARLCGKVLSVDLHDDFVTSAGKRLADLGIGNVSLAVHDVATAGLPDGTFDAIVISGSMPAFDEAMLGSLKPGGRLFVVCGDEPIMEAQLIVRGTSDDWHRTSLFETVLPRLRNLVEPSGFSF